MEDIKVIFAISQLKGGGAEHVMMQLANFFYKNNQNVLMLITNQKSQNADLVGLNEEIKTIFVEDNLISANKKSSLYKKIISVLCRFFEKMKVRVPHFLSKKSFVNVYGEHVETAKNILSDYRDWKVVTFLQPSNQIMLMACKELNIKIVISERGDPNRYFKTRYAGYFLKNYYPFVSGAVFQTQDAMNMYSVIKTTNKSIILNPISSDLPSAYVGERKKVILNFCRLAKQKNIPLLIDAFDEFANEYSDYSLEIIGSGELKEYLYNYADQKQNSDRIHFFDHRQNLHDSIKDYAMFVSSSDFEGMSNSMLEAMAIGLPVICTDCPIGGARAVIRDHVNGILVPICDKKSLISAMYEIASNEQFSEKLSKNASKIRLNQGIEEVGKQWMEIIQRA